MHLKEIINQIENFNVELGDDDFELTKFFDGIGEQLFKFGQVDKNEKKKIIQSLFNFLKRHTPELEENWSFIHLIESVDDTDYRIYEIELITFNKANPTLISILLLNRHINTIEGDEWNMGINLLKEISHNQLISKRIREEAQEYYDYQLDKKE